MKTVEHDGDRYLLVKRSGESSLVYDPETGERTYLPNDELQVTGESPLETAARSLPADALERAPLDTVHDERALGLLVELDEHGATPVRELLDRSDLCESDLHGLVGELRAAGLVAEARIYGERGYRTTDWATDALEERRDAENSKNCDSA